MGIFRRKDDNIQTGYKKDGPRKGGIPRFFEILVRDFVDLVKLNLLFSLCAFPSVVLFLLGLFDVFPVITFTLSIFAAFPIGGAITAYIFSLTSMLRDEPISVWYDCKRKFLENWKQAMPMGIICIAIVYAQVLLWGLLLQNQSEHGLIWVLASFVTLLLFFTIAPYIFLHFAYIGLGTLQIINNSILMTFSSFLRSLMGAVFAGAMWLWFALYFPLSLTIFPLMFLIGFSLSFLLCLMWIWPNFDKVFQIEETLSKRKDKK